jgi:hypothetical protein
VTALVTVPCPVDGGMGVINSTPGVENVRIIDMKYQEVKRTRDACGVYTVYKYKPRGGFWASLPSNY